MKNLLNKDSRFTKWSAAASAVADDANRIIQDFLATNEEQPRASIVTGIDAPWLTINDLNEIGPNVIYLEGLARSGKTTILRQVLKSYALDITSSEGSIHALKVIDADLSPRKPFFHEVILLRLGEVCRWLDSYPISDSEPGLLQALHWLLQRAREYWLDASSQALLYSHSEFRHRWLAFINSLMARLEQNSHLASVRLIIIPIDGLSMADDLRFIKDLAHPSIAFFLTGPPVTLWPKNHYIKKNVEVINLLRTPLVSALETLDVCFGERNLSIWYDLLRPLEHESVTATTRDLLSRSKFGFSVGDIYNYRYKRNDDIQIHLARILLLAKSELGESPFAETATWQLSLNTANNEQAVLGPGLRSGSGYVSSIPNITVMLASTVRVSREDVVKQVDELEVFSLVAGVVSPSAFRWNGHWQSQLVYSQIIFLEGHLSLGWPSWTNGVSPYHFLSRTIRFQSLMRTFLPPGQSVDLSFGIDRIVRMWSALQIAEFEDSTSDKRLNIARADFDLITAFSIAEYHSHGNVGALRHWLTDWLPVLVSPEAGIPDAICLEILRATVENERKQKREHGRINHLVRRWYSGRAKLLAEGRWRGQRERPPDDEILHFLHLHAGSFLGRICRLLGLNQNLYRTLSSVKESRWIAEKGLDARDAAILKSVLEDGGNLETLDLDSLLRAGISFRSFRTIEDFAISNAV